MSHETKMDGLSGRDVEAWAMIVLSKMMPKLTEKGLKVRILVEDLADEETLEALFLEDPLDLPSIHSGVAHAMELHDLDTSKEARIWLFSSAILHKMKKDGVDFLEDYLADLLVEELASYYRWPEDVSAQFARLV